jgi:hypothetical protein
MDKCTFARPGTYGHECGADAVVIAVFPSELTRSGEVLMGRCEECREIKGGENADLLRWAPLTQRRPNDWKCL